MEHNPLSTTAIQKALLPQLAFPPPQTLPTSAGLIQAVNTWLLSMRLEGANIDVYDVSDLLDIKETDRYQRSEGSGVIPHNAFWIEIMTGSFSLHWMAIALINVATKSEIVEVGNFDTSPFPSAPEFYGCWGVYPF